MVVKRKNAAILSNVLSLGGASASGPFEDKIQENNINVYSSPSEKVEKKLLPLKSKQSNIDLEKGSEQCQLESSLVVALDTVEQQSERNLRHEAGKPAANLKPGFGTGIGIETGSHCGIQRRGSLLTPLLTPCEVVVEKMPEKIIQQFVGVDTSKDSNVRVRNPSNNRPKPKSRQVLDSPPESMDALVVDHAGTAAVATTIEKPMLDLAHQLKTAINSLRSASATTGLTISQCYEMGLFSQGMAPAGGQTGPENPPRPPTTRTVKAYKPGPKSKKAATRSPIKQTDGAVTNSEDDEEDEVESVNAVAR